MKLNNKGESIEEVIFLLIVLFFPFLFKEYWIYILSAVLIFVLYRIIRWIRDRDFFSSFKENKIYYQGENGKKQLNKLEEEKNNGKDNQYKISCYKKGLYGENRILYTLSNMSQIPMYIMYDVALEYNRYRVQIDFIIITKKSVYLLETKNLEGNIEIEKDGTFIRKIGSLKKGIKSPITQNKEHEQVLKKILKKEKLNTELTSLVVFANDENYIHFKKGAEVYQKQIVRNDQLYAKFKKLEKGKHIIRQEQKIKKICDAILKYKTSNIKDEKQIIEELKLYRTRESFKEEAPAYMVYNDTTIDVLAKKRPFTKEDLKQIPGLGDYKIEKYGEDILHIINEE